MTSDYFIENLLNDLNHALYCEYQAVRSWCRNIWASGQACTFIMDHGPSHSEKVLKNINAVLETKLIANNQFLSDIEIYLICVASWLHDIGMQVEIKDGVLLQQQAPLAFKKQQNIRGRHAERSEEIIRKMRQSELGFAQKDSIICCEEYNLALSFLCGSHSGKDIQSIVQRLEAISPDPNRKNRLLFLLGLLKFGDAAHMSKDRVLGKEIENIYTQKHPVGKLRYYLERQYFNCLYIDDVSISVDNNSTIKCKLFCSQNEKGSEDTLSSQMDKYWKRIQREHTDSIYLMNCFIPIWSYSPDIKWESSKAEKSNCPSYLRLGDDVLKRPVYILGLIGAGQSAVTQLLAARKSADFQFRYFADENKKNRKMLEERLHYPANQIYDNYEELLRVKEIDVIVLATETKNHYRDAKAVLNAGKHLLLEKPATLCLPELKELIQIAEERELCFVCSLHAAFDNTINWIFDNENSASLLEMGWTNRIIKIECEFFDPYMFEGMPHVDRFESLHDSWVDSGINALSVVYRFIAADRIKFKQSYFVRSSHPNYNKTIIDAKVDYSFDGGVINIHTSWSKNINKKCTILTDDNDSQIRLDHTSQTVCLIKDGRNYNLIQFHEKRLEEQYVHLYKDFNAHLNNGTNNLNSALTLHELLFKATSASADGHQAH